MNEMHSVSTGGVVLDGWMSAGCVFASFCAVKLLDSDQQHALMKRSSLCFVSAALCLCLASL